MMKKGHAPWERLQHDVNRCGQYLETMKRAFDDAAPACKKREDAAGDAETVVPPPEAEAAAAAAGVARAPEAAVPSASQMSANFTTTATLNPADVKQASDRATKDQAATARTLRKLERRRCVHCGTLAPVTSPALPCCDGCGGPRYCDESCQRAHWIAGHQFECADATQ